MQQHRAPEENKCLVIIGEGFPIDEIPVCQDPKTAASDLRGRMRFARETTRRQGRALGGMQQHHAPEEDECLVVDEGLYLRGSQDKERKTFCLPDNFA